MGIGAYNAKSGDFSKLEWSYPQLVLLKQAEDNGNGNEFFFESRINDQEWRTNYKTWELKIQSEKFENGKIIKGL